LIVLITMETTNRPIAVGQQPPSRTGTDGSARLIKQALRVLVGIRGTVHGMPIYRLTERSNTYTRGEISLRLVAGEGMRRMSMVIPHR
jgi:hypothetical protein